MFWNNLSATEAQEYYDLIKLIGRWVAHCQSMRARKPPQEPDYSAGPSDADYFRWNELWNKFWTTSIAAVRGTLNP